MASTTDDRDDSGAGADRLRARNPVEFLAQVRQEGRRVTWATRQEVTVSTIMVVIMVALAAVFFYIVDVVIRFGIGFLLPRG